MTNAIASRFDRRMLLLVPGTLWLLCFCIAPLVLMVTMSFWSSNIYGTRPDFTFKNYTKFFQDPVYTGVLLSTLKTSIVTTFITLVVSYPVAWQLSILKGAGRKLMLLVVFLPFWSSYVIRSFVWLPILGRHGVINQLLLSLGIVKEPLDWLIYNQGATYVGLVYVYMLYMLLPLYLALSRIDPNLIEAAEDLGGSPVQIFRHVVWPLGLSGVLGGCVMVFLLDCGAFVTPQLLGGPSALMFGNLIAGQFMDGNNWAFGSALSVILIVIITVAVAIIARKIGMKTIVSPAGH